MDWAALEHAYGPATDVPELLEAIGAARRGAVASLANRVAHQGWCSPAVSRALTPRLLELAEGLTGEPLAEVLVLLADLSCAGSHEHVVGTGVGGAPIADHLSDPDVAAIRRMLAEHPLPPVLLRHRSATVRGAAALLLAVTGRAPEVVSELARRAARERARGPRIDLLLALGWAAADAGADVDRVVVQARGADDDAERAAAWIASAHAGHDLDDDAVMGLWEAVTVDPVEGSRWHGGELAAVAVAVLGHRASRDGRPDAIEGAMEAVDDRARSHLAARLMRHHFRDRLAALGDAEATEPLDVATLEPAQRALLALLCRYDGGFGYGTPQGFLVRKLGLPRNPPAMLRALTGEARAPDVLDRRIEIDGRGATLRELLPDLCTKERLARAPAVAARIAARFDAAEIVDVVELAQMERVPWGFTRTAITLHLLVGAGEAIVAPLRDRLARYGRDGPPTWWHDQWKSTATYLPVLMWAALHRLHPDAVEPKNLPLGRSQAHKVLEALEPVPGDAAAWLRAVVR